MRKKYYARNNIVCDEIYELCALLHYYYYYIILNAISKEIKGTFFFSRT